MNLIFLLFLLKASICLSPKMSILLCLKDISSTSLLQASPSHTFAISRLVSSKDYNLSSRMGTSSDSFANCYAILARSTVNTRLLSTLIDENSKSYKVVVAQPMQCRQSKKKQISQDQIQRYFSLIDRRLSNRRLETRNRKILGLMSVKFYRKSLSPECQNLRELKFIELFLRGLVGQGYSIDLAEGASRNITFSLSMPVSTNVFFLNPLSFIVR